MTIEALFSESDVTQVQIDELPQEGHAVGVLGRVPETYIPCPSLAPPAPEWPAHCAR